MDVLVQIIVVIMIIFSVLKQIKAVSDKSGELGKVPPPGRDADMDDTVKPTTGTARKPLPALSTHEPDLREFRTDVHRIEKLEDSGELNFPSDIEAEYFDQPTSVELDTLIPDDAGAELLSELKHSATTASLPAKQVKPVLDFSGQEVTRGIIMREILGPPVSLRSEESL